MEVFGKTDSLLFNALVPFQAPEAAQVSPFILVHDSNTLSPFVIMFRSDVKFTDGTPIEAPRRLVIHLHRGIPSYSNPTITPLLTHSFHPVSGSSAPNIFRKY